MPDTLRTLEDRAAEDRAAIADVIHRETACFRKMDFDGWAACHLHSPRACTVCASPSLGITVLRGWDAIRDDMASTFALGRTPCAMSDFRKDNMQITVDGDPVSWPRPVGGNTSGTLSIYDYPGFVQSAQPAFPALPAGA